MNSDGLKRLQELAAELADKSNTSGAGPTMGLPDIQLPKPLVAATTKSVPEPTGVPLTSMNRKQRRKAGAKAKRPNSNPAIHAYAERVRRMSDAQIWAEGHKEPDLHTVESVVRDIHEDLLSVLAPHFDDHTMKRIADVLGDWYGFDKNVIFQDGNTPLNDAKYVATAYAEDGKTPLVVGQVYRHFKGNYYRVVALAKMATALELEDDGTPQRLDGMDVVVYQSLNPMHPDWFFVRPVSEFISATPDRYLLHDKKLQRYRFVLVEEREVAFINAGET